MLCSILRVAGLKLYHNGRPLPAICKRCGRRDGFEHILQCISAQLVKAAPADADKMEQVEVLQNLARKARAIYAGGPLPMRQEGDACLELQSFSDSEDELHSDRSILGA